MNVAFCVYGGMTALDFVGAYDAVTRLERMDFLPLEWDVCAGADPVRADGLTLGVDRIEPDLGAYDLVVVPGGVDTRALRQDESLLEWIRTAAGAEYVASVCTGALLLGEAGFLEGRCATTHPMAMDLLAEYAEVREERVVRDGTVVTARGVTATIDLGLYLVELLADEETRAAIATQMDYPDDTEVFEAG